MKSLMDVAQVADHLAVSERTVRRLIDAREIGHHRIGRRLRVSHRQLEAYLDSTKTTVGFSN